ncbi:DNA-binding response regulator [Vreelandella alkaliphila]|uniref:DNA-binding response regulator n=1 Tax=Vreelandella alkaliphila TaxID=272774 RepID=A0AAJ2RXP4_9GAMM|nr:DNA-binding response regulator [Halomonas alkaliphila]MDX5978409.1 DNA-binding response regulator [Halomonas alkaliphila]
MDDLAGKKILIVDDAEADRMLISSYLLHQGCRIFHALDGVDGIHKARLVSPDLILMDVEMPECDGYAACKVLSSDPLTSNVPIIFLSAYSEPEKRVQGLLVGAVDYINKPYVFDEVKLRIAIHLRNRIPQKKPDHNEYDVVRQNSEQVNHIDNILYHSARIHLLNSLSDAPGLQELARLVGTNSKRLNAAFKNTVGVTVYEYLREIRMNEARELLTNTHLSVSTIASHVGFSSSANFSTAFKERFGTSPIKFKNQYPSPVKGSVKECQ